MSTSPEQLTHPLHPLDPHHIKLACQACQRKKIKCDRNFPCGQCNRSGLQCVQSSRKPRARHAIKRGIDGELRSRIAKLEGLVESLSSEVGNGGGATKTEAGDIDTGPPSPRTSTDSTSQPLRQGSREESSPVVSRYVASDFWSALSSEVQALKGVLDDEPHSSDDEGSQHGDAMPPSEARDIEAESSTAQDYDLLLCPPGLVYVMPGALNEPSPAMSLDLFNVFFLNVEPIFKVFHRPTLRAFLIKNESYLGHGPNEPCNRALKACIWFSALISISDEECQQRYSLPRDQLLQQYRKLADFKLSQADLVNTTDLAILQGLITYLAAARLIDVSRRVWTLTALLVRIAKAMNLHLEESAGESVFEAELKRRFWHQLQVLDAYCAVDRGSEPLVTASPASRSAPCNVNDIDFDENTTSPLTSRTNQLTDMTFARLVQDASLVVQRFNQSEDKPTSDTWQHRQDIANQFSRDVQKHYLQYCDPEIPFQRFILNAGKSMMSSMMLRAIRPMQKHVSSIPPRVDSPYVLKLAVNNLRRSHELYSLESVSRWLWLTWVPWHAIAVTLAGLCSIRDTPLADEAWELVDKAMDRYEKHVADTKNGMLWKPIQRLHRKAVAFRENGQRAHTSPPSLTTRQQSLQAPALTYSPTAESLYGPMNNVNGAAVPSWNLLNSTPVTEMPFQSTQPPASSFNPTPDVSFGVPGQLGFDTSAPAAVPSSSLPSEGASLSYMDNSWWDWEKIMKDLGDINVGEMNWVPG